MKLISLREYVLRFDKPIGFYADQFDYYEGQSNAMSYVISYTKFLSQKLELWMFIPCKFVDGVWVCLEEPNHHGKSIETMRELLKEYQEAKDRCIFTGFEINKEFPNLIMHKSGWGLSKIDLHLCTIETYSHNGYNLELTPTAQKLIGL